MALVNQPAILPGAFAAGGDKNTIPATNDGLSGLASIEKGFPPITQQPLAQGGLPPQRADFNGIFNLFSQFLLYLQNGGVFAYNNGLDYQPPCLVADPDSNIIYQCLQQNGPNTSAGVQGLTQTTYWQAIVLPTDSVVSGVTESNGTVTVNKADGSSDTFDVVTSVNEIDASNGNVSLPSFLSLEPYTSGKDTTLKAINSNDDLNNYTTAGNYYCASATIAQTLKNTPYTSGNFRFVVLINTNNVSGIYGTQFIFSFNNKIYFRTIRGVAPTFDPWQELVTANAGVNADYVVETYTNGTSWYRKYKSGWVEQGGRSDYVSSNIPLVVNLLLPMQNTNYYSGAVDTGASGSSYGTQNTSTSQITIYVNSGSNQQARWEVKGYGA